MIDDNTEMAECVAVATGRETKVFGNAIDAMNEISENGAPEMIFMEVLISGPDGFTLLIELVSYGDTAKVPIVVVSGVDFGGVNLSDYGVVGVLNKDTMRPEDVRMYVDMYATRRPR